MNNKSSEWEPSLGNTEVSGVITMSLSPSGFTGMFLGLQSVCSFSQSRAWGGAGREGNRWRDERETEKEGEGEMRERETGRKEGRDRERGRVRVRMTGRGRGLFFTIMVRKKPRLSFELNLS